MSTLDTTDLDAALTRLTDNELSVFVARMSGLAHSFHDTGDERVRDVFAALAVLGAEQQDRRRDLAEHARLALNGPDIGGLLDDPGL